VTRRLKTKITEQKGINFVSDVINTGNCIFNQIDTGNDIGIDAYVEFIDNETATGCCIGVQVKSGLSYFKSSNSCWIVSTDKDHLKYWASHVLPIAIINYNPTTNKAYWVDVTAYVQGEIERLENGPFRIEIPHGNQFSQSDFDKFRLHFLRYSDLQSSNGNILKAQVELLNNENSFEKRLSAMKYLFYFNRNSESTWHLFIGLIVISEDSELIEALIYFTRHIVPHGDIWWSEKNMITQNIRDYGRYLISELLSKNAIIKLLNAVDNDGFNRGTIGQDVVAILDCVHRQYEYLEEIAFAVNESPKVRYHALVLLGNEVQIGRIDEAVRLFENYINTFPDDCMEYPFEEYLECLRDGGYDIF